MMINFIPVLYCCAIILVGYLLFAVKHLIILLLILDLCMLLLILMLIEHMFYTPIYGYALIMLSLAAADTAVGLGLFVSFYKMTGKTVLV